MTTSKKILGVALAAGGSMCWGISGPMSEYLFEHEQIQLQWLITSKMTIAGLFLVLLGFVLQGRKMLAIWRDWRDILRLLLFTIIGMITMQYIYYKAVEVATAATATILQFLSPILIVIFYSVTQREKPRRTDVVTVAVALLGTYLLVTKGQLTSLAISPSALFWGIMSAFAAAAYTILPRTLLGKYGALSTVGWSMLIGGLLLNFKEPLWQEWPQMNQIGWLFYLFILIMGTVIAYLIYLASLNFITPTAASLLDSFEPLAATAVSIIFLHMTFGWAEALGGILILSTVFILAFAGPKTLAENQMDHQM